MENLKILNGRTDLRYAWFGRKTQTKQADNLISSALTLLCASPVPSLRSRNERCALSVKVYCGKARSRDSSPLLDQTKVNVDKEIQLSFQFRNGEEESLGSKSRCTERNAACTLHRAVS